MYYKNTSDLPIMVRRVLPSDAQTVYLRSFNKMWRMFEDFEERNERAHVAAWRMMQQYFEQNRLGKWVPRAAY